MLDQRKKASVDFQLVSKWQEKKHFQAWLKRPEHLQKHREAYRAEKEGNGKPSVVIKQEWTRLFLIRRLNCIFQQELS